MTDDRERSTVPPGIEALLREQLQAIAREEAPDRLLALARQLQALLRQDARSEAD
jgi:hypothetical protein